MRPGKNRMNIGLAGIIVMTMGALSAQAEVKLPRVLSSHMVLQRGMAVPIWGTADPGEKVAVEFRGQKKNTTADADGKWMIKLDPLKVGQPATLTIHASNTITLRDVLVGEVWVGSGQSNMDTEAPAYFNTDPILKEAASKSYPKLRLYHSVYGNGWQEATPQAVRQYSAQLFYFGLSLQKELKVPVGVMEGAVRGSPSANWIPDDVVRSDPGIQKAIADWEKYHPYAAEERRYAKALAEWEKKNARLPADTPKDKRPQKPWKAPPAGHTNGPRGDFYKKHICPMIPYAIRGVLWDQGEGGTNIHGVGQDVVMHALIACWRKDWGQGEFAFLYVQKPSGGGCALNPENPVNKGCSSFAELSKDPPQRYWDADARLQYQRIMENPNTFMVTATDLAPGVHPPNKSGYATRDCQVALGAVYGKDVEYYGPMYKSCKVEGKTLRLSFTHVGRGLTVPKGQTLQGFVLAGEDRKFYWADAVIDGDTVVLSSPKVPKPIAARYAWAYWIPWANLFNQGGLPAVTFRTDNWW